MTKFRWICVGLLILPILAAEMYVGLRVPGEIKRGNLPRTSAVPVVAGSFETRNRVEVPPVGSIEWAGLLEGWEKDDDDLFHQSLERILQRGTQIIPLLKTKMTSPEGTFESRLFAAELILRIDPIFDPAMIRASLENLCETEEGRQKLREYIKNKEGEVEIYDAAMEVLKKISYSESFPEMKSQLGSEYPSERVEGLERLAAFGAVDPRIASSVKSCLADKDPQVRSLAYNLVPNLFPNQANDWLTDVLVKEEDPNVVLHAGRVLSRIADESLLPALQDILRNKEKPSAQLAVAHIISSMKEKPSAQWVESNVFPHVLDMVGSRESAAHRAGAAAVLSRLTESYGNELTPVVEESVMALLADEKDPWVSSFLTRARNGLEN